VKRVWLTQRKYAVVDDIDVVWAYMWKWFADKNENTYYAKRNIKINGVRKKLYMHNEILTERMGLIIPNGYVTDHINWNGLDNRRNNLRIVTNSVNLFNQEKSGVYYHKKNNKWIAQIMINYKQYYLGSFVNREDAEAAYQFTKCQWLEHSILP